MSKNTAPCISLEEGEIVPVTDTHPAVREHAPEFVGSGLFLEVKRLSKPQLTALVEKHTKKLPSGEVEIDDQAIVNEAFNERLVSWNLKDSEGKPLPLTEEVKIKVCNSHSGLARVVSQVSLRSNVTTVQLDEETEAALEKNS